MKFIDLFAGIGGFHSGLTKAGMECVGWCEQDKYAQASYHALYPTDNLCFSPDIRALNGTEMPYADLWCFGFPCQSVSIAGLKHGMENTRSGLFYEVTRLLNKTKHKPKWLFIENVKNLLSIDNGWGSMAYCLKWTKQGTMCSGVCTTQKTLDYHKTVKGCTLSDILETDVPKTFYTDKTKANNLLFKSET